MAEIAESGGGQHKGKKRIKKHSTTIDMTPMVDIAFLLLIFYMVSTVFAMPQAMEINLPKPEDDKPVPIPQENVLTLHVDAASRYWWHIGVVNDTNKPHLLPSAPDTPDSLGYVFYPDTLRALLIARNQANPRLNTLVLIHRDADYRDMVNILDEIDYLERGWNAALAEKLGKDVTELTPEDGKFSYRYAIGDWEAKDDNIMSFALEAALESGKLKNR